MVFPPCLIMIGPEDLGFLALGLGFLAPLVFLGAGRPAYLDLAEDGATSPSP